jgi:hypothetical protein
MIKKCNIRVGDRCFVAEVPEDFTEADIKREILFETMEDIGQKHTNIKIEEVDGN